MLVVFTEAFEIMLMKAPLAVQKAMQKQVELLGKDLRHPSLHAKKYNQAQDIWQGRVNKHWRFYFIILDGKCYLTSIQPHPK